MLQSLREEKEGKLQMRLSLRKNGLTSLFKEVRVLKGSEALWCIPFFPDLWCIPFSLVFPGKRYAP